MAAFFQGILSSSLTHIIVSDVIGGLALLLAAIGIVALVGAFALGKTVTSQQVKSYFQGSYRFWSMVWDITAGIVFIIYIWSW